MRSVTPLPATLSGNIIERLIEIDEALIPYVSGALVWLCDKEPFEETGALTVDTARLLFSGMLQIYFEDFSVTPVGSTVIWHMDTIPDRWLICDGTGVLKADYPKLYDLFGGKYGESTDFFGVPDLRSRLPYGADFDIELDEEAGESTHTLLTAEMPVHQHRIGKSSGTVDLTAARPAANARTDLISAPHMMTDEQGGGEAHNNIPPVLGVNFIVYAGR